MTSSIVPSGDDKNRQLFNELAILLEQGEERALRRQERLERQKEEDDAYLLALQSRVAALVQNQGIQLKDHEVRLDKQDLSIARIERTIDNKDFVSIRKVFEWAGRPENDNHNSVLGQFLGALCRHYGYRDQFVQQEAHNPVYKTCKKYTVELMVAVLEELQYDIPLQLQQVEPCNNLVLNKGLAWKWNNFLEKFYPHLKRD
jgi:hypothetical protein